MRSEETIPARVAIVGSRNYAHLHLVIEYVRHILPPDTIVVSGGAQGVDAVAIATAKSRGLQWVEHLPDWDTYGKPAGPIRNSRIVEDSTAVLAYWDGKSSGTIDVMRKAYNAGKLQWIVGPDAKLMWMSGPNSGVPPFMATPRFSDNDTASLFAE